MQTSTLPVEVAAPATPATPADPARGGGRSGEAPGFAAVLDRATAERREPEGEGPAGGLPEAAVEAVAGTPAAAVLAAIGRFTEPLATEEVAVAVAGGGAAVGLVGDPFDLTLGTIATALPGAGDTADAGSTATATMIATTATGATVSDSTGPGGATIAPPAPPAGTAAPESVEPIATDPAVATPAAEVGTPVPADAIGADAGDPAEAGPIVSGPGTTEVTAPLASAVETTAGDATAGDEGAGEEAIAAAPPGAAAETSAGTPTDAAPLGTTTAIPTGSVLAGADPAPVSGTAATSTGSGTTELVARPADVPEALLETARRLERDGADGWRLQIRLDPPELGRVHLDLVIRGNQLHVTLNADTAGGASALAGQRESIERMLAAQGFELGSFDVASGRRDRPAGDRPADPGTRSRRGDAPGQGGPIRGLGPLAGTHLTDTPGGPTGSRVVHL